jgi:glycosyltransferase involved in cell wall biosynthesis
MRRSRVNDLISGLRSLISNQPVTILRDERAEMFSQLAGVCEHQAFDAIHADQLSMAQYALYAQRQMQKHQPELTPLMVLDAHNAYFLIPQRIAEVSRNLVMRLIWKREAALLKRYERNAYMQFKHILTVTPDDQNAIRTLFRSGDPAPEFTNIPICVDSREGPLQRIPEAGAVLLLGGLHWLPNADAARWFMRDIWMQIKQAVPQAQVFIIGQKPPEDLRAYGDYPNISQPDLAKGAPVVVTGYVDDPRPFISASAALLVPLRSGGGMRVKIVDALNWGLPVVSTTIGCEGISVTHGTNILIADTAAEFAHATIRLLQSPALRESMSQHGRQLIENTYDWRQSYLALDAIYTDTQ